MTHHIMLSNPAIPLFQAAQSQPPSRMTTTHALALPSESLLKGQKIVEIVHNGSLYKLQATKLGKLILTK